MRLRLISSRELEKKSGLKSGGHTRGNTIYHTKDAGEFVIEHEKAHVELGHKPANLNKHQFIKRELKADKIAVRKTGVKYRKYYLNDIVDDVAKRFSISKSNARKVVNGEAKRLRLI